MRKQKLIRRITKKIVSAYRRIVSKPIKPKILTYTPVRTNLLCRERIKRNDDIRRKNYFKAYQSGGSSRRPEHNRKHNRTC